MIQIPYNSRSLREANRWLRQSISLIQEYAESVSSVSDKTSVLLSLMRQLPFVLRACNGDLRGKRILDLGCGSVQTRSYMKDFVGDDRFYEPWLCRFLKHAGEVPIGIDVNDNSDEIFENYRIDLTQRDCLRNFPDNYFDIAYAGAFFTLPNFEDYSRVKENLIFQLERIVKPNGYFVFEEL